MRLASAISRLTPRTFTVSSPKMPSTLPVVLSATNCSSCSSVRPVFSASCGICTAAEAGLMWGSRPEPEAVIRSVGMSSTVRSGCSARNSSMSPCTRSARAGLDAP